MSVVGRFRLAHLFASLAAVSVVMTQAAMERTTAFAKPPGDAIISATERRGLHDLPFIHTHIYVPPPEINSQTQTPTLWSDDEYYTDDGAITVNMVREKKDLYQQERYEENANNEDENENKPSAFDSEQGVASSATDTHRWRRIDLLITGGINTILVWSFVFW